MDFFNLKEPQIRRILWAVALGLVGVLLLVISGSFNQGARQRAPGDYVGDKGTGTNPGYRAGMDLAYESRIEEELASILSEVDGAGKVSVKVFFETSEAYEYAKNTVEEEKTIEERDAGNNTTRLTKESRRTGEIVNSRPGATGQGAPLVIRTTQARVSGVIVVADGAREPAIKRQLGEAVQTLLGIPAHKVMVLPRKR